MGKAHLALVMESNNLQDLEYPVLLTSQPILFQVWLKDQAQQISIEQGFGNCG